MGFFIGFPVLIGRKQFTQKYEKHEVISKQENTHSLPSWTSSEPILVIFLINKTLQVWSWCKTLEEISEQASWQVATGEPNQGL